MSRLRPSRFFFILLDVGGNTLFLGGNGRLMRTYMGSLVKRHVFSFLG